MSTGMQPGRYINMDMDMDMDMEMEMEMEIEEGDTRRFIGCMLTASSGRVAACPEIPFNARGSGDGTPHPHQLQQELGRE